MAIFDFISAEKAYAFRVTHIANLSWILDHGFHCRNSNCVDPGFHQIGNPQIIDRRVDWQVPCKPFGNLGDYIPFYFTPGSMMLFNIVTGFNVARVERSELVIIVSSLHNWEQLGLPFVFTSGHAVAAISMYFNDLSNLAVPSRMIT